ncbi:hypothetical protein F4779DRAFT_631676 [Xylariaceae sp. FL0662B]|nr:hypothetical protein F4779DRAFT_631676 [Xylariaceae sp. FL0662B]
MGRTAPSVGRPPASFRRDARAKRAKATVNKVIPALLSAHPRARHGIQSAELIVDPPPAADPVQSATETDIGSQGRNGGRSRPGENATASIPRRGPRLSLRIADTLTAARALQLLSLPLPADDPGATAPHRRDPSNRRARVGVLNMASPLSPGGGVLNGATGAEARLCARSTLLPSLREAFYRLPEVGGVWTPDVLRARWYVDVFSAAMPRLPDTRPDARTGGRPAYAREADRGLVRAKMRAALRVFAARGVRRVVLGAWGCGAYGNPVGEVARAWRGGKRGRGKGGTGGRKDGKDSRQREESWAGFFSHVVFAIPDAGMAEAFREAFGAELLEYDDDDDDDDTLYQIDGEDEDEDVEDARIRELREKIQQLELQAGQARTTQLRAGLNAVLVGLRNQLPPDSNDQEDDPEDRLGVEEGEEGSEEENPSAEELEEDDYKEEGNYSEDENDGR